MSDTGTKTAENSVIVKAWQCLPRIASLAFTTTPGPRSRTGWAGTGHAEVLCEHGHDTLRFSETGLFTPADSDRPLNFHNSFRWERRADVLSLSHERFGRDRPVWLFDLIATGNDCLTSADPHVCNADLYQAKLTLTQAGFTLQWSISGPAKDETLIYHYRVADPVHKDVDAPAHR
ncbi:DUF6314 family protein [Salinisphaera aquimarina]|uniref:DUF6314 family protein n=1 Tax=Salinisphaera aquimarina TaxID=2094031 RepID=A0ABV7EMW8_9GAMM